MASSEPKQKWSHEVKHAIVIAVLIFVPFYALAIPQVMTDGTERLTREEVGPALSALSSSQLDGLDRAVRSILHTQVDDVLKIPSDKAQGLRCGLGGERNPGLEALDDPNAESGKYVVVVSHRTFFGLVQDSFLRYEC